MTESLRTLFDSRYYARHKTELHPDADPLDYYLAEGERLGHQPSFVFNPTWYWQQYPAARTTSALKHYLIEGEKLGHKPSPLFDPTWYAHQNQIDLTAESALAHYLAADPRTRAPNAYFSAKSYTDAYRDIAEADIDPYDHYVSWGVFEGRLGSEVFDAGFIWQQYLSGDRTKNPFALFLEYGVPLGWKATRSIEEHTVPREIRRFVSPGTEFAQKQQIATGVCRVKALAFYLPQFHPIPENDAWWGKGFTEWRNVVRGVPRFAGHFQPRIPRDLGFYELSDTAIMRAQVDMARASGLFGFCFYYYNFSGKRLLERPLDAFVNDEAIDFPFCLLWANENWSRRWDGLDQEVLIGQSYSTTAENALVDDLARYMKNPRYIRIDGRPLFFLYRSDVIPGTVNAVKRWRDRFKSVHDLDPLIVMAQAFGCNDPRPGGFDGAVEFPPHKFGAVLPQVNNTVEILDSDFKGQVYSYDDLVEESVRDFPSEFPLIKTVVPSWDNDARKQGSGLVVQGSTPDKFRSWVERLSTKIVAQPFFGSPLMVVNAWNEWCEGAYLEPDVHFGYAYINALATALSTNFHVSQPRRILLVGHDAFPAGAQMLLYNIGRTLKTSFGVDVSFILMDGGGLVDQYRKIGETFVADTTSDFWPSLREHVEELRSRGFSVALTNSAYSGHCVQFLVDSGFKVSSLIHELKTIIKTSGGIDRYKQILRHSSDVVYPNNYVRNELIEEFGPPSGKEHVIPQGLYKGVTVDETKRDYIRNLLKLSPAARIVLNVGYADLRKGVDLFLSVARETERLDPDIHFVWVGNTDPAIKAWLLDDVRRGRVRNVTFLAHTDAIGDMFNSADLFFLTSREDPFPSVVLEALAIGLPVGAYDTGGGYVDLIRSQPFAGFLAPADDNRMAAQLIVDQLNQERSHGATLRDVRRTLIQNSYDFRAYTFGLLGLTERTPKISVIVPNYNYKQYMTARLASIFGQSHPQWEVIVLDDCSTDGSIAELEKLSDVLGREFTLIENAVNSGNVFAQWRRGIEAATGDLIWIAEADDLSDPSFLDHLVPLFQDPAMHLAFTDSRTIDEFGVAQWDSYKGYYETLFPGALAESGVFDGETFLRDYLSVKNIILNVSCALWRKDALAEALVRCQDELKQFKMAGDWRIYAELCMLGGKIGYVSQPLNVYRRHSTSVTHALKKETHRGEIMAMHQMVRDKLGAETPIAKQDSYVREVSREFGLV